MKGFGNYKSGEEYQNYMRESNKQRKANDYEVFNYCSCLECKYFKVSKESCTHGDCQLMWKEKAFGGVMAQAVCNRFISTNGTDITGKRV